MRADRLAAVLGALAVGAAVVLGVWATGGPMQGRAERRDEVRFQDLLSLKEQVDCLADAANRTLPARLEETDLCLIADRYVDPFTGEPYVYKRVSATGFRLCAEFEAPEMTRFIHGTFDAKAGCLSFDLKYRY